MTLKDVIQANRQSLSLVPTFVSPEEYNKSPDNYGLPPTVFPLLDLPINDSPTYIDLILFLRSFLSSPSVKYLEIGVSVLKTFFQAANFLNDSRLYAFDINSINPTMAPYFLPMGTGNDTTSYYSYKSNKIAYVRGDVFKESSWDQLRKTIDDPVDIIFSDAHHTGEGLIAEYNYYIKNALAEDFILYYDDLHNPANGMPEAFKEIYLKIKTDRPDVTGAFLKANGWLGQHEFQHLNGIITSLDLKELAAAHFPDVPLGYLEITTQ
jgi:hypothetical protein